MPEPTNLIMDDFTANAVGTIHYYRQLLRERERLECTLEWVNQEIARLEALMPAATTRDALAA